MTDAELRTLRAKFTGLDLSIVSPALALALVDELERLRAEHAKLLDCVGRDYWRYDGDPLPSDEQAQRIRAAALEEAAEAVKYLSHEDGLGMGSRRVERELRAMAALPSTLCVVPHRAVDMVRHTSANMLEFLESEFGNPDGNDWSNERAAFAADELEAALAALEAVK